MIINHNLAANQAARLLNSSAAALSKSLARLSSGSRVVSPEDDAAGLAQATRLHSQDLRDMAAKTVLANGASFLQTKDGFLGKIQKALNRMGELSVLAMDITKTNADRSAYDAEFQALASQITDIGGKTFNGKSLFNSEYTRVNSAGITWTDAKAAAEAAGGHLATIGSSGELNAIMAAVGAGANLWIGLTDEETEGQFKWVTGESANFTNWLPGGPDNFGGGQDYVKLSDLSAGQWDDDSNSGANIVGYVVETAPKLVINGDLDTITLDMSGVPELSDSIGTIAAATTALANVTSAINQIASQRAAVGASLARVQAETDSLAIKHENVRQAISRIVDVDVAEESTNFARQNILVQSGTAMLAQANTMPQSVLKLLG